MNCPARICAGDWKLIEFFEDGRLELYNLKDDIGEKHNLASAQPVKLKELQSQLVAWQNRVKVPMPKKNTYFRPPEASGAGDEDVGMNGQLDDDDDDGIGEVLQKASLTYTANGYK